jgi:competence protein ComEA
MMRRAESVHSWSCLVFLLLGLMGLSLVFGVLPASAQAQKGLIDLNTATQKDLESIKGIGPANARKIIAGRPYQSVEDLKKAGIPEKTIESMKPHVTVGSAPPPATPAVETRSAALPETTKTPAKASAPGRLAPGQKVNLNTATKEQLEALPGIGPTKAKAIIEGRPYKTTEDVMKVKGIKKGTFNKIKDNIAVQP